MTYTTIQQNTLAIASAYSVRTVSSVLLGLVVFAAIGYVYLLAATTVNVTMRKTLDGESREIQSEIADLEASYLNKRSTLTIGEAKERGFIEDIHQVFVYRHMTSENLALLQ